MEEIVIVGAARTAIGKFGGALAKTSACCPWSVGSVPGSSDPIYAPRLFQPLDQRRRCFVALCWKGGLYHRKPYLNSQGRLRGISGSCPVPSDSVESLTKSYLLARNITILL